MKVRLPAPLYRAALIRFGRLPWPLQRRLISAGTVSWALGTTAVVEDDAGRLLLVRHSYKPGWLLPGGFLDRDETAADAVVRELREELGLEAVAVGSPQTVLRHRDRIVEFIQRAALVNPEDAASLRPASPEISEVGWFAPDQVPPLPWPAVEGLALLRAAEAQQRAADGAGGSR